MIEKILERLEEGWRSYIFRNEDFYNGIRRGYDESMKIVSEAAKEYDEFDVIYKKLCKLEKEYAEGGDSENVSRCIRLQNLLQYFKEELKAPYQKGE